MSLTTTTQEIYSKVLADDLTSYSMDGIQQWAMGILGTFLGIAMAALVTVAVIKTEIGKIIALIGGALLAVAFIFMTDQTIAFFKAILGTFFNV